MKRKSDLIPAFIVAAMLLIAMAELPYGYYQLLRWVVCGVAVYIAYMAYKCGRIWATWVLGFVAVLFNPFIPIYLAKEIWRPIDFICAILFAVSTFFLKQPHQESRSGKL